MPPMKHIKRLAACLGLLPLQVSCWGKVDPCPGVVMGATYRVVVGRALPDDAVGCIEVWGLSQETTFSATVNEVAGDSTCMVGAPEISELLRWTFRRHSTNIVDTGFLQGLYDGQFGDCPASVQLRIRDETSNEIACFQGTETSAECGLTIAIQPKAVTGCAHMCTARRAVTVTRL